MDTEPYYYGDKISTVDSKGGRRWIYAFQPRGGLYRYRTVLSLVYLALFFSLPFVRVKGVPLFLFDFPQATFIFFGKVFLPQDFILLGVGMLTSLLFIIVFTLVFGRIFCGWACPQTIFMEMVFRRIEYWIEGPAQKQMVADRKEWSVDLYVRKTIKHLVFFALSFLIANTFLAYIIGTDALFHIITEPVAEHIGGFIAILGFTAAFYAVYAFVREIVCTVICPYGRLQSVLLDKNSLVVAYDHVRGEPRSKRKKAGNGPTGDCIDCGMCVHVCPTGIDIRDGLQMECINCTACIDACNLMMDKTGRPRQLIRIASEASIAEGRKTRINYRTRAYGIVLAALLVILAGLIITRAKFDATVLRVPGQILQENNDGTISNLYRIKIVNKSMHPEPYRLALDDKDARIEYVGRHLDSLYTGKTAEETFFIKVPAPKIRRRKEQYRLLILSGDQVVQTRKVTFIGTY
ncbi:cytochrome c oxidase accessory protein CcoG [Taibaiella helva]|uniref:cytochrome c oxidase accessory protein CcoG n=1 Tax=Taibaiella helva TaxID=2301235 RepID=UPI000E56D303|nr:cytochrome c oxidase accessory protein CcoG [Taibaiella helva]